MINNTLPINSLKNKTIELFQKEMIEDIIINNQLNCKCLLIMDNISSNLISKYISFSEIINSGIFSIDSIYKTSISGSKDVYYVHYRLQNSNTSAESKTALVKIDKKNLSFGIFNIIK